MKPDDILLSLKGRQAVKFMRPMDKLPKIIYMPKEQEEDKNTLLHGLINDSFPIFLQDLDDSLNSLRNDKFLCGEILTIYDFRICAFFC